MSDKRFSKPKVAIDRVYTRGGDKGETSIVGGARLGKDSPRVEAYGTIDELNAQLGLALATANEQRGDQLLDPLLAILRRVQHEAFNLGSLLATAPGSLGEAQPRITAEHVAALERNIDELNADLVPLTSFLLPGGSRLSAQLHVCRTVCRRAERRCAALLRAEPQTDGTTLRYVNRLSDLLFVLSRWADKVGGAEETLWDPNQE